VRDEDWVPGPTELDDPVDQSVLAVSAQDPYELERAIADIEQAAIQTSCETRRLWGQQAQAFSAAALPLCRTI
jgi:hypothetical protein